MIDCCYAVALHAPHTYTGETMAELQCHGSTAVLCAGLDALFAQGVRQAEAGEFTRRAFLNGKMGLSEAEAVHDLITARTAEAAQNAAAQVMGAVGSPVQQMRDELLGMVAHFHAVVDFPDEDIDPVLFEDAAALLHRTTSRLYSMAESYERGRILREGVPCVILGRPNAGKSTLLNTLTGAGIEANDRLFDTLDPTTRKKRISDTQEILLSDTVGFIRKLPHHLVSAFKATLEELAYADLLLHVVDVSDENWQIHAQTVDKVVAQLGAQDIPRVMVYNKADKCAPDVIPFIRPDEGVKISAKSGEGIDDLLTAIEKALGKGKHKVKLCIPYSDGAVLDMLHREAQIDSTDYAAEGTIVEAVVDDKTYGRVSTYIMDNE